MGAPSIILPSSNIVEISQNFYWPLYTKPIDWIYQSHISSTTNTFSDEDIVMKVVDELQGLLFFNEESQQPSEQSLDNGINRSEKTQKLQKDLEEEKEDWFNDLSGGQKSKVELVRKVFLSKKCPEVLLIDETLAPLDPASKGLVMSKLKSFCRESIVLVIYHSDVTSERPSGFDSENGNVANIPVDCVPSSGFFDQNLHVENGILIQRPVC